MTVLGTVVGTRGNPNTPDEFHFWIHPEEETLGIGSIVRAQSPEGTVVGMVEEMKSYSEIDDPILHQLSRGGDPLQNTPSQEQIVVVCKAKVLKQEKDRPLKEGVVSYPSMDEMEALFNVEGCTIPVGVFENTDGTHMPVKIDESYLLGYEGAHVNISGMSGLGTKTSTFLFLLNSVFAKAHEKVACIIFNIKSDDLLYIDEPSPSLTDQDRERYATCGIAPGGFKSRFFAPDWVFKGGSSLREDVEVFRWGYKDVVRYIPSLLRAGSEDQKDKLDTAFYDLKKMIKARGLDSLHEIMEFMTEELLIDSRGGGDLVRGSYKATWGKLYNQLKGLETKYEGLMTSYPDEVREIPYSEIGDREAWVIDIQRLGFYPQKLIFEKVISEMINRLEAGALKVDRLIIFMDEMNKYAPSQGSSDVASLKAKLVDISARGRSIGVSLFGAEQFRSKIDSNVEGNMSTDIIGKTKDAELGDPIYRKFSEEIKGKIRRFKKDDKLVDHELYDVPIFVKVPRPPCMMGSEKVKGVELPSYLKRYS